MNCIHCKDLPFVCEVCEAQRDVGKWLNEEPNRGVDKHHLSILICELVRLQEFEKKVFRYSCPNITKGEIP